MSDCRRSVLSCARCRRRKIKCDRAIPCGQCVSAKAECTGYSSKDQDPNVPRSLVQHLESEIAKIEGELARNGHLEELNASDILAGMPTHNGMPFTDQGNPIPELNKVDDKLPMPIAPELTSPEMQDAGRSEIMNCGEFQAMVFAVVTTGPGITDLLARVRMSLTPSRAIGFGSPREVRRRSLTRTSDEVSCIILKNIPTNIVRSLVKKYMATICPIFPIIDAPTLWKQLDTVVAVLQTLSPKHKTVPPSYDFFIIYMILCTASTLGSAKTGHEQKHMRFSGGLFEEGIHHLSGKAKVPSDLAGVQMTMFVLQYATINPRLGNVWILSGAVMRACLELGLHREPPSTLR